MTDQDLPLADNSTDVPDGASAKPPQPPLPEGPQELRVEKLVYGGEGLSRFHGQVVFTPFTAPGELVSARISKGRKGLLQGTLLEVIEPAAGRTVPPCPVYTRCGGCQLQHLTPEEQLAQKVEILRETLQRIGRIRLDTDIQTLAADPLHYRNRIQLHFDEGRVGFLAASSHRQVDTSACPISSPKINEVIAIFAAMAKEPRFPRFLHAAEIFTNETEVQINITASDKPLAKWFFEWCADEIAGFVPGELDYTVGLQRFRVSGKSFFQVNRYLLEPLAALATRNLKGKLALDLYSGVGLFALPLTRSFEHVHAVESSRSATDDCAYNAQRAAIDLGVSHINVDEYLAKFRQQPDFILADPPRSGLGTKVVEQLLRLKAPTVRIVSCDPSTLARDLSPLLQGGYAITNLTLVDLFPQTYHLETVAELSLK